MQQALCAVAAPGEVSGFGPSPVPFPCCGVEVGSALCLPLLTATEEVHSFGQNHCFLKVCGPQLLCRSLGCGAGGARRDVGSALERHPVGTCVETGPASGPRAVLECVWTVPVFR